jgi:AraC family transcriptional regulator
MSADAALCEHRASAPEPSFSSKPATQERSNRCVAPAPQRDAVFEHAAHISTLHQTFYSIWNRGLPTSGFKAVAAPELERYSVDYDPVTSTGVLEIWLPVEPSA